MSALLGMLAISLVSTIVSAAISASTAYRNIESQEKINAENVQAQKDINAENVEAQKLINQQNIDYSKEFAQNQIQWKMADLQAAGLNPTMAAGMSSGTYQPTALSAPTQKAPMQQAPMLDMNGVSSALNAMSNMMMTSYILSQRNNIQSDRNDIISRQGNERNQILSDKNNVLRDLYKRKASVLGHLSNYKASDSKFVGNAKQIAAATKSADWDEIMKELDKIPYKYKFRP